VEAATSSLYIGFDHGAAVSSINNVRVVPVDIVRMRVRSVRVLSNDSRLLGLIVTSMPGNPASASCVLACSQTIRSPADVTSVLSIVLIVYTVVEASHCATQIVSCIKRRATVCLLKPPA
jgi:hypothetical protein